MSNIVRKENMTIVVGTYTDNQGQEKKRYRTIGELVTMTGDDGNEFQFGNIWGPHGETKFNVYPQEDRNAQQQPQQGGYQQQQPPQGGYGGPNF